jgi:hypothetical protein
LVERGDRALARRDRRRSGPVAAAALPHSNKSSLLLSFKKEDNSFLKKRSKRLFDILGWPAPAFSGR